MSDTRPFAVVGSGAMGIATAWHLARTGEPVVVLEQYADGHVVGASHGSTRNLSAAYHLDTYHELLAETRDLWRQLESESGETLIDWVGVVQHGDPEPLGAVFAAHGRHGIDSEWVPAADAESRWSGLRFAGDALFTRDAGRIRAADGLRVLRALAEAAGAEFRYESPVLSIEATDGGAVLHLDGGVLHARRVIVTSGAWTRKLIPAGIALPRLRVTQEQPAHFAERPGDHTWPGFMHTPMPGLARDAWWPATVYGMLTPAEGIKVGFHGSGPEIDPDRRTFQPVEEQLGALRRYVAEWIPGADSEWFVPISCTYTTTPTEDFVLDRVGPIVIGAGFSGHGFKFTPVIGRILADLAHDRPAPGLFSLRR